MLANPMLATCLARDWKGAPPMYMMMGQHEVGMDAARVLASQLRKDNVPLVYEEYEAMPHVFYAFFPKWWQADHALRRCADACLQFTERSNATTIKSKATFYTLDKNEQHTDVDALPAIEMQTAEDIIRHYMATTPYIIGQVTARAAL